MRTIVVWFVAVAAVLQVERSVDAEPLGQIQGRVLDKEFGLPAEGVMVQVTGPDGNVKTLRTGDNGSYWMLVAPGNYRVLFIAQGPKGTHHVAESLAVDAGQVKLLDARVDTAVGEVITIHEQLPPKKLPRALNWPIRKAPPYSEKALTADAWTRAWLLLDISPSGDVSRFKWLHRPGYELEAIAEREVWKLKFSPAINGEGKVSQLYALWKFEWISQSWSNRGGDGRSMWTQSHLPSDYELRGIRCKNNGGWSQVGTFIGYRDCTKPDLKKATTEAWVVRPR